MDDGNTKKTPILSVIVPVYNAENDLERQLDSVLGNDLQDFEVILIDDGSTDRSGAICDKYVAQDSERIRVVHTENGGISAARNLGLSLATGKYFIFVDADDWCEPQLFSSLVGAAERSGAAAACCGVRYIDEATGTVSEYEDSLFPRRLAGKTVDFRNCGAVLNGLLDCATWNKVFLRSYVAKLGLEYEVGLKFAEDNKFWAEFFFSGAQIAVVDGCFYNYRINQQKQTVSVIARENYDSLAETMRYIMKSMKKHGIFEEFKGEFFVYLAYQFIAAYGMITQGRRRDFFIECSAVYREAGAFRITTQGGVLVKIISAFAAFAFGKSPYMFARVLLLPSGLIARPKLKRTLRLLAGVSESRRQYAQETDKY